MNDRNLKTLSPSEARELGAKGGKASGEARRKKKAIKEAMEILLERDVHDKHGNVMTGTEAIVLKVYEKALKGDLRAFEIIQNTTGQKPIDQVQIEHSTQSNGELLELIQAIRGDAK